MDKHDTIIALNNHGSIQIRQGRYQDAITTLAKAVQYSQVLLQEISLSAKESPYRAPTEWLKEFDCWVDPSILSGGVYTQSPAENLIHHAPMQVPFTTPKKLSASTLVSSAIIFNLALAHSLLAQTYEEGTQRRLYLQKATKLFEHSLQLHRRVSRDQHTSWLFLIVCTLSMAECHRALGQHQTARQMIDTLHTLVLFQVGPFSGKTVDHDKSALEFLERITTMLLSSTAAAAAA